MEPLDADEIIRDVGRRVAELRAARSLTQAQLAERADVSLKYLQRVEAGGENLTIRSLVKLASLLGVGVRELFDSPRSRAAAKGATAGVVA